MRRRALGRFAVVGLLVTGTDVGLFLLLAAYVDTPAALADACAVLVAAVLSRLLHRRFTFAGEPHLRWVEEPGIFVRVTLLAGAVDVAVLASVVDVMSPLAAKLFALLPAAAVRALDYRASLQPVVRAEQARRVERGPASGARAVSIVVPAFHEERRIAATIARLRAANIADDVEVVVVDDGSTDGTADAARAAGADQVVVLPANKGKGAAVRAGMLAARGRTCVFTDADLAYAPEQIPGLVAEVEAGADIVVGSRRHVDASTLVRARRLREITGRVFNLLTFVVLLGHYRDTQCGLKAFRSDAARLLFGQTRIDGFAFDVEVLHLAERYRLALREVPVEVTNDRASTVRVVRDALRMVRDVFRVRWHAAHGAYEPAPAPEGRPASAPN